MALHRWLGSRYILDKIVPDIPSKADLTWNNIRDKGVDIQFVNAAGTKLALQKVRIESDSRPNPVESVAGTSVKRKITIFGLKGHATLPDTDIKSGYTFQYQDDRYRVMDIITGTVGEIQATAEATR